MGVECGVVIVVRNIGVVVCDDVVVVVVVVVVGSIVVVVVFVVHVDVGGGCGGIAEVMVVDVGDVVVCCVAYAVLL